MGFMVPLPVKLPMKAVLTSNVTNVYWLAAEFSLSRALVYLSLDSVSAAGWDVRWCREEELTKRCLAQRQHRPQGPTVRST